MPPTRLATTGTPMAIASCTASPKASVRDGEQQHVPVGQLLVGIHPGAVDDAVGSRRGQQRLGPGALRSRDRGRRQCGTRCPHRSGAARRRRTRRCPCAWTPCPASPRRAAAAPPVRLPREGPVRPSTRCAARCPAPAAALRPPPRPPRRCPPDAQAARPRTQRSRRRAPREPAGRRGVRRAGEPTPRAATARCWRGSARPAARRPTRARRAGTGAWTPACAPRRAIPAAHRSSGAAAARRCRPCARAAAAPLRRRRARAPRRRTPTRATRAAAPLAAGTAKRRRAPVRGVPRRSASAGRRSSRENTRPQPCCAADAGFALG